jgi:hypothetical protein
MAVEKHLQAARQEARVYLERPGTLRFLGQDVTPTQTFSRYLPDEPTALFAELRDRIFTDTRLDCFPTGALEARYVGDAVSMNVSELAHVVSCALCLERINRVLGLPTLMDRFPSDTLDRDRGGSEPPGPAGSGSQYTKLKKGVQQTQEHRPKKLQVAVDGEIRAAQRISSTLSELQVKLEPLAKPAFIEVFSEQGIRLAYLQLDESMMTDPEPHLTSVTLSDGRLLEVNLGFPGGIPVVNLSYYDPLLEERTALTSTPKSGLEESSNIPSESIFGRSKAAVEMFLGEWFTSFESPWPLGLAMGVAGLLLVLSLTSLTQKKSPAQPAVPTAKALLTRSREIEEASIGHGGAIHSTFSLQTLSQDGKILESQKVESWRSFAPSRTALRLLDNKGKVVAGKWTDAEGNITTYNSSGGLRRGFQPSSPRSSFSDALEFAPGEDALSALTTVGDEPKVDHRGDEYEIQYERSQARSNPDVVRATLVLNSSSVQAIREDVTIERQGDVREFRFRRLTYAIVSANQIQDGNFTPDTGLIGLRTGLVQRDQRDRGSHLMLAALQLLSELGPDVEQMVDIERLQDGRTEVSGVLSTISQKISVERLLRSLGDSGELKLDLHSRDEAHRSSVRPEPTRVESIEQMVVDKSPIPLDSDLRGTLSAQGFSGEEREARIRRIASTAIDHGARIHREAWSIRQIAARDFTLRDLQLMQPEQRKLWVALLERHASLLNQQLSSLDQDLAFLFYNRGPASPAAKATLSPPNNPRQLAVLADTLNHDCEELDRLLLAGFTLSPSETSRKITIAELAQLVANVRTREQILWETIGHLSRFSQAEVIK